NQAKGLSANTITRLKGKWLEEHDQWRRRDLNNKRYVYFWADGALGFWKAMTKTYPGCRHQRCWVHKTANVLNKLPKSMQPKV
ncbi:transposase, partial [Amphritea pacifica]|uniref:transposase n=1 Tax=Amphritea pacifica TaxID=2811233 RepID=UPI0019634039